VRDRKIIYTEIAFSFWSQHILLQYLYIFFMTVFTEKAIIQMQETRETGKGYILGKHRENNVYSLRYHQV